MIDTRWYDSGHGAVTPWGNADSRNDYADGIAFYSTPSHGGFRLTADREAELDAKLRAVGTTAEQARMGYSAGWFEEDCSSLAVLYGWPELFQTAPADCDHQGGPAGDRACSRCCQCSECLSERAAEYLEQLRYWLTPVRERQGGSA